MLSLLRSRPSRSLRRPSPVRLLLESLEGRDCPAAPTFASFTAVPTNSGREVILSGQVNDETPANLTVNFSGMAGGSAVTNAAGAFSLTTTATGLGTVNAQVMDMQMLMGNASATITSQAPTITLSVSYGSARTVTLSGTVTDEAPGGRTVTFTGQVTGTVQTNANGAFSFTAVATGLGSVQATTTDAWNQQSNAAQVSLTSLAPTIVNFQAVENPNNLWTFTGQVIDESAPGLVVQLSGIPELQGVTVTVDSTGWFSINVQLDPDRIGVVTAQTTDWWALLSNLAQASVT